MALRELLEQVRARIREIDPDDAAALLEQGASLLDVREADEVMSGSVPGSQHIPRGLLETSVATAIPDLGHPIVVMCAGGTRSAFAADTLAQLGYTDVTSMSGGFDAWKAAGHAWGEPRALSAEQRARYQRHLNLPEVGEHGQQRLLDSKVLLVGAGGLGSPAALYLAAAGVGTIGIVDADSVDRSNLQRQVIHGIDRLGMSKVDSAARTIANINPDVAVERFDVRMGTDNATSLCEGWDVIVDGADNFETRYALDDASTTLGVPVVHGSIFRFEGQVAVFAPGRGPSYRDMIPSAPPAELAPNCSEAGVLGALPGIVGSLQAIETIKLLLDLGDPLIGRLLVFDALDMEFREYLL